MFNYFHVIKLFNEKLSQLRRDLYREATDTLQKKVLKRKRWLLLKNPENLDDELDERQRLQDALSLNQLLATAYYLKEDLRQFWDQPDKTTAAAFLQGWISRAASSGIKVFQQLSQTIAAQRSGLLAYYDVRISTAPWKARTTR